MATSEIPEKRELRARFLGLRQGLGVASGVRGERAQRSLLALESYRRARAIMVYLAFRGEVETALIIEDALRRGLVLAAPQTLRDERRLVPLRLSGREGELRPGAYGLLEPDPALCSPVVPESLDLVVVPGVAFDESGGRLGYGGGYYDRFLRREAGGATRVALGFDIQISLEPLPLDLHDARMHLIVTESRVLTTCPGACPEPSTLPRT